MASCRRLFNLTKRNKTLNYTFRKLYSTSIEAKPTSNESDEIIVPYRIHRGSTDILKALASTISKDYTAPAYKYEDDPYFIPASNVSKRAFALSKESGKKAARYFLEKYPELFVCNKSEPHIKAFNPPTVYTEANVSSEDTLIECIKDFHVNNSVTVYQILKDKGITVSQETKQDLLELLCFYNGTQPLDEDYYEERYFQKRDLIGEKWNAKGAAERLFDEMEKDSKAYSAMIAGAGKFQDAERVQSLYGEMIGKNLIPTVEAYNSLISVVPIMKERRDEGSEYTLFLLANMQKDGVVPNLDTMNAVLETFRRRQFRRTKELSLNVLAEMKRLNIEPSLGTYKFIASIFCDDVANGEVGALYAIIDEIEEKELTARHPSDVTFFSFAMEKCWRSAQDKSLAYRINKIAENNCKLLGNALSESRYFKCFFSLLCETEELDKFMEIYEQYVPNTYVPEPGLMLEIINNVHFSGSYKYLPKLCSDILVFEQTEREMILSVVMEAAGSMTHETEIQKKLVDVIGKIVDKINTRLERRKYYDFRWTGSVLGNAVNTFINGEDLEKSWSVIKKLGQDELTTIGVPEKDTFLKFCSLGLQQQEYEKVKFCIKYAQKVAYPEFSDDIKKLTEDLFAKEKLLPKQRLLVNEIIESTSSAKVSSGSSSDSSSDEEDKD